MYERNELESCPAEGNTPEGNGWGCFLWLFVMFIMMGIYILFFNH